MKSPRISIYGFLVAVMLSVTAISLAQSAATANPATATTPTGPLHFVSGPKDVKEAFLTHAERPTNVILPDGKVESNVNLHPIDQQSLEITGPLPNYDINSSASANNLRAIASSAGAGLLYFVEDAGKPIAVVQVHINSAGQAVVSAMQFIAEEPNANTLKTLAAFEQIRKGSYEVRYLRSQPYGLKAIWLKPLHEGTDYIYVAPYGFYGKPGERNGIMPDKLYTLDEFLKLFVPMVKAKESAPDNPNAYD